MTTFKFSYYQTKTVFAEEAHVHGMEPQQVIDNLNEGIFEVVKARGSFPYVIVQTSPDRRVVGYIGLANEADNEQTDFELLDH